MGKSNETKLRKILKERSILQKQFCLMIKKKYGLYIMPCNMSQYVNGKIRSMTLPMAQVIAGTLDMTVDEVFAPIIQPL